MKFKVKSQFAEQRYLFSKTNARKAEHENSCYYNSEFNQGEKQSFKSFLKIGLHTICKKDNFHKRNKRKNKTRHGTTLFPCSLTSSQTSWCSSHLPAVGWWVIHEQARSSR